MRTLKNRKIIKKILKFLDDREILAIHGSRQVGKTSLLHYLSDHYLRTKAGPSNLVYFDLEDFVLLELCNRGPDEVVKYLKGKGADFNRKTYLLIDEIQYLENPSSFLKLFHDRYRNSVKLLVTGSSSFLIKKKFRDSLAGRIIDFELFPLDFEEFLDFKELTYKLDSSSETLNRELLPLYEQHIIYGGYPAVVLEDDIEKKETKLKQVINAYLKRDIRDLAAIRNIEKFNNLLRILASQSANLLNIAELSNTLGIAKRTVEEYLFILENTYILKKIYPYHKNIRSELTKMPKIFFEDTGMLNLLVNKTFSTVVTGQLLETSIYLLFRKNMDVENVAFWRTNKGQEIDFVLNFPKKNRLVPVEVKLSFAAKHQRNLRCFMEKYPVPNGYLCCLDKIRASREDRITVAFPWQMYNLFLK